MNATRFASLSAAFITVALATVGCANTRDDYATQTQTPAPAPMTPYVAAPMVQQPDPIVVQAPAPVWVASAPVYPATTTAPAIMVAPTSSMSDNTLTERAARADRN